VAKTTAENGSRLPRSLNGHRAIRRELVALYREAKAGQVDPALTGRLVHLLATLSNTIEKHELEDRITTLEAAAGLGEPNGHDRAGRWSP